ncbi:MAG: hypothetical protein PHW46_06170 [Candidatus Omnitrophica bacterium]|nr:hypothetical protein [Candidatus Omnitrophota bacterium]
MKNVVYRNIFGDNPKKHEVSLEEISGVSRPMLSKKWICKHFIKDVFSSRNTEELKNWIRMKRQSGNVRDCNFLREVNTFTGEDKVVCKVRGQIFVLYKNTVYEIVYVNEFRLQVGGIKEKVTNEVSDEDNA